MKKMHRSTVMKNLNELISALNNFDACIRQNITFFRDASVFSQHLADSLDERYVYNFVKNDFNRIYYIFNTLLYSMNEQLLTHTTINHITQLTRLLSKHIKQLEQLPLPYKYNYIYTPLENLDDYQLFQKPLTDFEPKNLKVI